MRMLARDFFFREKEFCPMRANSYLWIFQEISCPINPSPHSHLFFLVNKSPTFNPNNQPAAYLNKCLVISIAYFKVCQNIAYFCVGQLRLTMAFFLVLVYTSKYIHVICFFASNVNSIPWFFWVNWLDILSRILRNIYGLKCLGK